MPSPELQGVEQEEAGSEGRVASVRVLEHVHVVPGNGG